MPGTERTPVVLVHAPFGRDAALICEVLEREGIAHEGCETIAQVLEGLAEGGGPAVVTEETIAESVLEALVAGMAAEPAWSDVPLIVLGRSGRSVRRELGPLLARRNVSVLYRPLRTAAFAGVIRTAVEARARQLEVRDLLRKLRRMNARVERRAEQLRRMSLEMAEVEQRERQRISRLLHDHLQQILAAARIQLGILRRRNVAPEGGATIDRAESLLDEAIESSRTLAAELSPPLLRDATLGEALEWLGEKMEREQRLRVEVLDAERGAWSVDEDGKFLLFDAVRELLFNVSKHAQTDRAVVRLAARPGGGVVLSVEDSGRGFDPEAIEQQPDTGIGLFHLRDRIEALGGRMEVRSIVGGGCSVRVEMGATSRASV